MESPGYTGALVNVLCRNFGFVSLPVLTKLEGAFLGAESDLFCLYSSLVINPEGDAAVY